MMKYKIIRYKPDSCDLVPTPPLIFDTWTEAWEFCQEKKTAGERGWRITYIWI